MIDSKVEEAMKNKQELRKEVRKELATMLSGFELEAATKAVVYRILRYYPNFPEDYTGWTPEKDKSNWISLVWDYCPKKYKPKHENYKPDAREQIESAYEIYKESFDAEPLLKLLKKYPEAAEELRIETVKFLKEIGIKKLWRLGSTKGRKGVLSYTYDLKRLRASLESEEDIELTSLYRWASRKTFSLPITPEVEKKIIASDDTANYEDHSRDPIDECEVLLRA